MVKGVVAGITPSSARRSTTRTERAPISELSTRSLLRMQHTLRNSGIHFRSLQTLTYPAEFSTDGREVKRHLNAFLVAFARKYGAAESYAWFLEFQRRGAPHFHVLTTVAEDAIDRQWFAETWARICGGGEACRRVHAHRDQWQALRSEDGALRYVAKYASKPKQKEVPEEFRSVGRFWGTSRDVKPQPLGFIACDCFELVDLARTAGFLGVQKDGKLWPRNYWWDLADDLRARRAASLRSAEATEENPGDPKGPGEVEAVPDLPRGHGPAGLRHRRLPPAGRREGRPQAGAGGLVRPERNEDRAPLAHPGQGQRTREPAHEGLARDHGRAIDECLVLG